MDSTEYEIRSRGMLAFRLEALTADEIGSATEYIPGLTQKQHEELRVLLAARQGKGDQKLAAAISLFCAPTHYRSTT